MKYLVSLIPVLLLTGCGNEISKVKDALIDHHQAYKNSLILDGRTVCQDTKWQNYEEEGNKFVKYSCLLTSGEEFSVYSQKEIEQIVKEKQDALMQDLVREQEIRINEYYERIDKLERYISGFDGLSTQERNEISMFGIEDVRLRDTITEYAKTPEGKEIFKALSIMNTGFRLTSPIADFNVKIRSVDPEIQQAVKRILLDTIPIYVEKVKAKIDSIKVTMAGENASVINAYSIKLVDRYQKTHPVSRTEVVIWTWNKLDQQYVRVNQYLEQEWVSGEKTQDPLCLERIVYSVTHNVTKMDDYYNLSNHCSY